MASAAITTISSLVHVMPDSVVFCATLPQAIQVSLLCQHVSSQLTVSLKHKIFALLLQIARASKSAALLATKLGNCGRLSEVVAGLYWPESLALNGKKYAISDASLSWTDALEACESVNASLAAIESREEQDMLAAFASPLFM